MNFCHSLVDGAIHAAAGKGLLDECKKLGFTKPGDAKLSKGYHLPASCEYSRTKAFKQKKNFISAYRRYSCCWTYGQGSCCIKICL